MKEDRIKDLETIKQVFDKHNVRLFLVYGALLGFYRDGTFLPGDDDIDLCVVDPIDLETRQKIGETLFHLGFLSQEIFFNVNGTMTLQEEKYNGDHKTGIIVCQRNFKFTIFFFKEVPCEKHDKEYLCVPMAGAKNLISIPSKFFKKSDIIKIGRNKYLTPSPIKDYLEYSYEDWKDKDKRDHSPTWYIAHENT